MPCCIALNCSNRSEMKGIRVFRFPSERDKKRRAQWINNVGRGGGWQPTTASRLCSIHFEESQFEKNRADGWKKLKPNAIPTIFNTIDLSLPIKICGDNNKRQGKNLNHYTTQIFHKSAVTTKNNTRTSTASIKMDPIILVHGGAGNIPNSRVQPKIDGNKMSVEAGYKILQNGGSALDAVEAAVRVMEDDEAFNAGYGSVLNLDGEVEMDASVMVGSDLRAGAVTVVKDIKNPISLARLVMEKTPHVLLAGAGANKFAEEQGIPRVPPGSLVSPVAKKALEEFKKRKDQRTEIGEKNPGEVGTVGAVAIDKNGHLAAATSTGGINGKMVGRSSDTSLIGSGTYADGNIGAVSTTGHGETITKYCLAHAIIKDMEYGNNSANDATNQILESMTSRLKNTAGAITLSKTGEVGIGFTSQRMSWAYRKGNEIHYGIDKGQHEVEKVK